MIRIIGCIVDGHDLRLVGLAALLCAFGCYTTLTVLERARVGDHQRGNGHWLMASAIVAGASVWTTHFVAMLAYRPGLLVGYNIPLTAMSIALAVSVSWIAFAIAHRYRAPALGGAIFGCAVGAMHYTGMSALSVPADFHWDPPYVAGSIVIGITLGAAAFRFFAKGFGLRHRIAATVFMTLAIAGHHFTAMTALTLSPDPLVPISAGAILPPDWLAIVVTVVMVGIVVFGLSASAVDHHLGARAIEEAERLRRYVTELEQTKRELEATTADLHRAFEAAAAGSQAKSQFLATMSHELRTPLNAIIGFSELMANEVFGPLANPRYKEYAASVQASGKHLLGLINDILDFSKIDAGRLELQETVIDLGDVVASVLQMSQGQAESAGVQVVNALSDRLPGVRADERRLRQVLLNLLSNAIKFTPRGGQIRIGGELSATGVAISVSDNGIGIAPEDIPKALERFGQIDSRLSRKYEGTGLGLPLSKRLMELHGGSLDLTSVVGAGTAVTITLPRDRIVVERAAA